MFFAINRQEAGKLLAKELHDYKGTDTVVYALPRGGVVLGFQVAKALNVPLDIIITRKIGHPDNPEYAVCAVTEEGESVCNEFEKSLLDPVWLKKEMEKEQEEALRRRKTYLGDRKHIAAHGKTAIVVDDGIATGLTIFAAIQALKKEKPKKIIVAVPVAPHDMALKLRKEVDDVVTLEDTDNYLGSVGAYYGDFPQVGDQEVIELLESK
ncbi:MAG: phosphoribosyl transferase [Candidatus Staskawiczbacteria bacterium]|nr:phosphoribosyl transferase [Candidatus Staskawiczbacteria bacterium]